MNHKRTYCECGRPATVAHTGQMVCERCNTMDRARNNRTARKRPRGYPTDWYKVSGIKLAID